MKKREVAIVHYNTPELTEAAILSLRKHGGARYHVTVFDNSDERPFKKRMKGVTVIDNTQGQIIDFNAELAKFPNKCPSIGCAPNIYFGSDKHMMSIQKLWELIPDGFLLMDSDILIQQDVDFMFIEDECCVGHIQKAYLHGNPHGIDRMVPMLCYINVPMCVAGGAKYFDPSRSWGLISVSRREKGNWYDTGASFLEDIRTLKPQCHGLSIDIRPLMLHYGSGSWKFKEKDAHLKWLEEHRELWEPIKRPRSKKIALCAIGRLENRYAREFVEHYLSIGFDKIFIYDNNQGDEEHFEDVLIGYENVEIIDWRNRRGRTQREAYTDFYAREGANYQWIAFFDFDEFLTITDGRDIHKFMKDYDDADCLVVNWKNMTDSGLIRYEDKPLAERFTEALPDDREDVCGNVINSHIKSIVRGGLTELQWAANPHIPSSPGLRIVNTDDEKVEQKPFQPILHSKAFLRHYSTKTIEEWLTIKKVRRFPEPDFVNKGWEARHLDWFFCVNERTKEKQDFINSFQK